MALSLVTRAKMLAKGLLGASLGAIQHMLHRQDHQTLVNHLEAEARAARQRAMGPKPKGVTLIAGGPGWKPSSPSVVSAFMPARIYDPQGPRSAGSYRGWRRAEAKLNRRAALGGFARLTREALRNGDPLPPYQA